MKLEDRVIIYLLGGTKLQTHNMVKIFCSLVSFCLK